MAHDALTKPIDFKDAESMQLADDFFDLVETQLKKMSARQRNTIVAGIHATAEALRMNH